MTLLSMLDDADLVAEISRLTRVLERLDREPTRRAVEEGHHVQCLLDELEAELARRIEETAAAARVLGGEG